jgi:drug/metabolite transporter (DMT)-like permease
MLPSTALIVLPVTAALLYATAAMVLKRSSDLGVGVWRTTFVANMVVAAVFSSLWWILGGPPVNPELLWQPGIIALCLFAAQLCQFIALDRGDVSVAVPVFGLKVVIVAWVTPFLIGEDVGAGLWLAAALSVLGITFLNRKDSARPGKSLAVTFIAGGAGSVGFALFDILVQKWGPQWGAGRLLPMIFWINAVLSLGLVTQFTAPLKAVSKQAWRWLLSGSVLLGLQSVFFVCFLAIYGRATAANVVYSARGLISVLLVWSIGHWFSNKERDMGGKTLFWRLAGALLMLSAIVIVLMA